MDNDQLITLLGKVALQDQRAFQQLYELTSAKLFGIAQTLLREPALAEDALQDTFVQVWHRAADYHSDRGGVMTWLATLVRYRAIDLSRRRRGNVLLPSNEADDPTTRPDQLAQALESSSQLGACMKRLSDLQRRCIGLAFFEGMTHEELSLRISSPLGTVKSHIRRGVKRLRECLLE